MKWTGALVCVLLIGLFALSMGYQVDWKNTDASVVVTFWCGHLSFNHYPFERPTASHLGWKASRIQLSDSFWRRVTIPFRPPGLVWNNGRIWLQLPLWIPFVIVASASAVLWWRERTIPPGHCPTCGYNLTGNVSGRCPECGQAVASGGQ